MGDLEQIKECSSVYNGPDDDLTDLAQQLVDKLRKELQQQFNPAKTKISADQGFLDPNKIMSTMRKAQRAEKELSRSKKQEVESVRDEEASILVKATEKEI